MTFEDFRCHFGGLFIVSSTDPFRLDGYNIQRSYRAHSDVGLMQSTTVPEFFGDFYKYRERRLTAPHEAFVRAFVKCQTGSNHFQIPSDVSCLKRQGNASAPSSPQQYLVDRKKSSDVRFFKRLAFSKDKLCRNSEDSQSSSSVSQLSEDEMSSVSTCSSQSQQPHQQRAMFMNKRKSHGSPKDPSTKPASVFTSFVKARRRKSACEKQKQSSPLSERFFPSNTNNGSFEKPSMTNKNFVKKHSLDAGVNAQSAQINCSSSAGRGSNISSSNDALIEIGPNRDIMKTCHDSPGTAFEKPAPASASFNSPGDSSLKDGVWTPESTRPYNIRGRIESTTDSCFSSSDISVHMLNTEDHRPQSAPTPTRILRDATSCSISSLTQSSFLATKADFFQSSGKWKLILEQRACWSSKYYFLEVQITYSYSIL